MYSVRWLNHLLYFARIFRWIGLPVSSAPWMTARWGLGLFWTLGAAGFWPARAGGLPSPADTVFGSGMSPELLLLDAEEIVRGLHPV